MAHYFHFNPIGAADKLEEVCECWGLTSTHEMFKYIHASGLFRMDVVQNNLIVKSLTIADDTDHEIDIKPSVAKIGEHLFVMWQSDNKDAAESFNHITRCIDALPDDNKFGEAVTDIIDENTKDFMFLYILVSPLKEENTLLMGAFDLTDVKSFHMHFKYNKCRPGVDDNKPYCSFIKFELNT